MVIDERANAGGRDVEKKGAIAVLLEHQETNPGYYTDTVVKGTTMCIMQNCLRDTSTTMCAILAICESETMSP